MPRDEGEFRSFVQSRWPALVRYAYVLTGDAGHAEDAVQAALERTWRRWRQVRTDRPEAYVRSAIVHEVISRRRWLRRRVAETPLYVTESVRSAVSDGAESRARREVVWSELSSLPPRMRAVVVLRIWEDLSVEQTAELLGCSTGSVKSQLSRGLDRLRARAGLRAEVGFGETSAGGERLVDATCQADVACEGGAVR
ncbi:MAG: SigE family RNA polymerase sigma factor [Actinomycetales bacterium]|nr:SigE family RNA polymerase sigma factor [Actinomycetales bacterium]